MGARLGSGLGQRHKRRRRGASFRPDPFFGPACQGPACQGPASGGRGPVHALECCRSGPAERRLCFDAAAPLRLWSWSRGLARAFRPRGRTRQPRRLHSRHRSPRNLSAGGCVRPPAGHHLNHGHSVGASARTVGASAGRTAPCGRAVAPAPARDPLLHARGPAHRDSERCRPDARPARAQSAGPGPGVTATLGRGPFRVAHGRGAAVAR